MRISNDRFTIDLELNDPKFAVAPTDFQRDWSLDRALREFGLDLEHLDTVLADFVSGEERAAIVDNWEGSQAAYDDKELIIQGQQVMQAWEYPLMRQLAFDAAENGGDVLEVGFGMGISATLLQEAGVGSYTIVECNEDVIERFEHWRSTRFPDRDIRLVKGMWQDVVDQLGYYDGILFDTYPLSQEEYLKNEKGGLSFTHCGEFFPVAAEILRPGGVFSYFTCEIDSLSRTHQRLLLKYFDGFAVSVVRDLEPPEGCQYWWSDSMVAVRAYKG